MALGPKEASELKKEVKELENEIDAFLAENFHNGLTSINFDIKKSYQRSSSKSYL